MRMLTCFKPACPYILSTPVRIHVIITAHPTPRAINRSDCALKIIRNNGLSKRNPFRCLEFNSIQFQMKNMINYLQSMDE